MSDDRRLGERGQIYVTLSAAERYVELRRMRPEEARRELTELLIEARVQSEGPPMLVRARSRRTSLDITARVAREGGLLVVVSVNVKGTVKGHKEYEGVPETVLLRCKLVEVK